MAAIESNTQIRPSIATAAPGYVEWSAILGGTAVALAVSFVLLTFGAAAGLSAVSPWTSTSASVKAVGLGSAFWLLLVNIWAFALGGYLSARMRHRWAIATESEAHFRDGTHGILVWAAAVTLAGIVTAGTAATVARGAASAVGTAAGSAASTAQTVIVDQLLRGLRPAESQGGSEVRAEISRILANSLSSGTLPAADRTYLAEIVASRTGISPQEAERRVASAIDTARSATDRARKTAVLLGFLTAATLLIGAAAAWWGATVGGRHRDEGTVWSGLARHERLS